MNPFTFFHLRHRTTEAVCVWFNPRLISDIGQTSVPLSVVKLRAGTTFNLSANLVDTWLYSSTVSDKYILDGKLYLGCKCSINSCFPPISLAIEYDEVEQLLWTSTSTQRTCCGEKFSTAQWYNAACKRQNISWQEAGCLFSSHRGTDSAPSLVESFQQPL